MKAGSFLAQTIIRSPRCIMLYHHQFISVHRANAVLSELLGSWGVPVPVDSCSCGSQRRRRVGPPSRYAHPRAKEFFTTPQQLEALEWSTSILLNSSKNVVYSLHSLPKIIVDSWMVAPWIIWSELTSECICLGSYACLEGKGQPKRRPS